MNNPMQVMTTIAAAVVLATGCGSSVSASERIDGCLEKQPDATEADCKKWEKDDQLKDDGTHEGHESM